MDLKEKVLDYKDEVVKEIQNAIRVKSVKEAPCREIGRASCRKRV